MNVPVSGLSKVKQTRRNPNYYSDREEYTKPTIRTSVYISVFVSDIRFNKYPGFRPYLVGNSTDYVKIKTNLLWIGSTNGEEIIMLPSQSESSVKLNLLLCNVMNSDSPISRLYLKTLLYY